MGQRGRGMPCFFPREEAPVGVLQPPMRRAEQRSARSQPDVPLTQRRSPLGRLNVKNEEIDEMIKEAPGPINFTVFLTMFGEKLKGEGVPRELGGVGSHRRQRSVPPGEATQLLGPPSPCRVTEAPRRSQVGAAKERQVGLISILVQSLDRGDQSKGTSGLTPTLPPPAGGQEQVSVP